MSDCIFCSIVDGDIPSETVYEDETVVAFLDANPLARGHTLVIPKAHHERVNDLPAALAGDLFETVQRLTGRVERAVDASATTIAVNNGPVAGQEVPHVHVHVVPRFEDDDAGPVHALFGNRPEADADDLAAVAAAITAD
jgi:histidine triad (HIT) family protein